MKKHLIIVSTLMIMISSSLSAQYCPPNTSSRWDNNTSILNNTGWNSYANTTSLYSYSTPLQRLAYSFSNVVNEGYRLGKLTDREIRSLERDFRSIEREIRWASSNRNISFHEQTMIDMQIRRLQRNIKREWNDEDTRIG